MASNLSGALRALARRMQINATFTSKIRRPLRHLWYPGISLAGSHLLHDGFGAQCRKMLIDMRSAPDPSAAPSSGSAHFYKIVYIPASIELLSLCWSSGAV